jgi:hypothetical protein
MSQGRLSGLATSCIEKGQLNQINVNNIINDFAYKMKIIYIISALVYFAKLIAILARV